MSAKRRPSVRRKWAWWLLDAVVAVALIAVGLAVVWLPDWLPYRYFLVASTPLPDASAGAGVNLLGRRIYYIARSPTRLVARLTDPFGEVAQVVPLPSARDYRFAVARNRAIFLADVDTGQVYRLIGDVLEPDCRLPVAGLAHLAVDHYGGFVVVDTAAPHVLQYYHRHLGTMEPVRSTSAKPLPTRRITSLATVEGAIVACEEGTGRLYTLHRGSRERLPEMNVTVATVAPTTRHVSPKRDANCFCAGGEWVTAVRPTFHAMKPIRLPRGSTVLGVSGYGASIAVLADGPSGGRQLRLYRRLVRAEPRSSSARRSRTRWSP